MTLLRSLLLFFFSFCSVGKISLLNTKEQGLAHRPHVRTEKTFHWNWSKVNLHDISFPKGFLFGVGTSAYQVEGGCDNNQYCEHEGSQRMPDFCGDACDHWNRYKEDVQLIKKLGANSYRFSVEWSKVQPQEDYFNSRALQHYVDVCDELLANGIKPVITIHHYTDPIWFAQKGGFEKEENIKYYVEYAAKLFEVLGNKVHLWLTFNSPSGYALPGYVVGDKPPYKKSMRLGIKVLQNLCEAHVQTYQRIKKMPGGQQSKIGILKNICQLDPITWWNPMSKLYAKIGNGLANNCILRFFSTGVFSTWLPGTMYKNALAPKSLDFIGLNYYSHTGIKGFSRCAYPGERAMCKKDHTIYAEGLYRALKTVSDAIAKPLNIPVYVTENGIAPIKESDRDLFLKRYFYAMSEAIRDGIDVRGYFYWSLMDNYEWGTYNDRYGLYHVDFSTQKRTFKPSAQYFVDVAHRFSAV